MADSKITALTAISTVDPTADPLVIVDVSDTSMAASGTTKKSTINQLLGAGGTATLASATITGALTGQSSASFYTGTALPLHIRNSGTSFTQIGDNGTIGAGTAFIVGSSDASLRFQCGGAEQMRLNATGLGVGLAPANDKLLVSQTIGLVTSTTSDVNFRNIGNTTIQRIRYDDSTGTLTIGSALGTAYPVQIGGNTTTRAVTIDASGNLILLPSNTPATLATNGQLTVNATSNTNLRFSYRGSDGVTRVANITLA